MFKGEYQGGSFVEVFSAQGREPISRKCRVTGSSTTIHKQYDKDVKSYVYILEGEPTTTKIQLPKDERQTLCLLQRFLVLQLFVPFGRSFSFEIAVSDVAQNKRRIFFSSSQKEITVTPLHAKFPLTVLCSGTWLNLCLDLNSLVGETFNGQTFRALESVTVTANCRLKKIFTLKIPPVDTTADNDILSSYDKTEPLPKALQIMTTHDIRPVTQVLSYGKLARKCQGDYSSTVPVDNGGSTPRQDPMETHIAFGSKVVIPPHVRKNSQKENQECITGKTTRTSSSSHGRNKVSHSSSDFRHETTKSKQKPPLKRRENQLDSQSPSDGSKETLGQSVTTNQAAIQPRPPKTSSAGKFRRPVRVKSGSAGKARTPFAKSENPNDNSSFKTSDLSSVTGKTKPYSKSLTDRDSGEEKQRTTETEVDVSLNKQDRNSDIKLADNVGVSNVANKAEFTIQTIRHCVQAKEDRSLFASTKTGSDVLDKEELTKSCVDDNGQTQHDFGSSSEDVPSNSDWDHKRSKNSDDDFILQKENALDSTCRTSSINNKDTNGELEENGMRESSTSLVRSKEGISKPAILSDDRQLEEVLQILQKPTNSADVNNNEEITKESLSTKSIPPIVSPLTENNPVFTFASRPRSARSGKKKSLQSPLADDRSSSAEKSPEVRVSFEEHAEGESPKSDGPRGRGALLEDDFCKLSDDESREDNDGIQKLLNSSLSPRHSPMPFHHHLRQSIRSSMLKEIPSPVKQNGYDAQNYQSDSHLAALNQSTASSWRFDTSDSSCSFNQTQQDLEDSLDTSDLKRLKSTTTGSDGVFGDDIEDDHDSLSDGSDDTTFGTCRPPPRDLRGNKYRNEMKLPGNEPDLTATISIDPRAYCDVFSPPIVLPSSKADHSAGVPLVSPTRPLKSSHILQSPVKQHNEDVEEELDLLYDPCLNCYYDPKTHKYYELA